MYGKYKRKTNGQGSKKSGTSFKKAPRTMAIYRPRFQSMSKSYKVGGKWKNPLFTGGLFKFKYADTDFNMSTTVGGGYNTVNVFSGNSPYDPDVTGVGVQPYGWDNTAALFGHYRCIGSKIKARFYAGESGILKAVCTVVPHVDNAMDYYDPSDLRVTSRAKQRIISSTEGIVKGNFITSWCKTSSLFPDQTTKDADFGATINTSPGVRWYWHCYVDTSDTATEDTVYMDVEITYYCTMRKTQNNNEN